MRHPIALTAEFMQGKHHGARLLSVKGSAATGYSPPVPLTLVPPQTKSVCPVM